jgi:hypothetical protein
VIGKLFIVKLPHARNERTASLLFRPIDCFLLRLERAEHMIRLIFCDVVGYRLVLRPPLGTRFDVDIRHDLFSPSFRWLRSTRWGCLCAALAVLPRITPISNLPSGAQGSLFRDDARAVIIASPENCRGRRRPALWAITGHARIP